MITNIWWYFLAKIMIFFVATEHCIRRNLRTHCLQLPNDKYMAVIRRQRELKCINILPIADTTLDGLRSVWCVRVNVTGFDSISLLYQTERIIDSTINNWEKQNETWWRTIWYDSPKIIILMYSHFNSQSNNLQGPVVRNIQSRLNSYKLVQRHEMKYAVGTTNRIANMRFC